jgi:hypothetical protein
MITSENDRNKGNRITTYRYDAGDDGERLVRHQSSVSKTTFSKGLRRAESRRRWSRTSSQLVVAFG